MARSFEGKVAIIQFPGVNCEYETADAVRSVGLGADLLRWNEDPAMLEDAVGVVVPGGFSYQDRIRAGVVSAKDHIMDKLSELAAEGRPILGICNGAQVLVESGFIPGIRWESVELALAPNVMEDREGYFCTWTYLLRGGADCAWAASIGEGDIVPVPIAHAEGRFTTDDEDVLEEMKANGQIVLRYCTRAGAVEKKFPVNPNGSLENMAGVTNREGNVLAMMPHPERASWMRQVPEDLAGPWGAKRRKSAGDASKMEAAGPGRIFFESLKEWKGGGA